MPALRELKKSPHPMRGRGASRRVHGGRTTRRLWYNDLTWPYCQLQVMREVVAQANTKGAARKPPVARWPVILQKKTPRRVYPTRGLPRSLRRHHADVMRGRKFVLTMCARKSEVNSVSLRCAGSEGDAAMNSIHRSILVRSLMTGAASLAFTMMGARWGSCRD
jgi:hypothetical protein